MTEPFDAFRYMSYLWSNWRGIAGAAGIAVTLALAASLIMRPEYTATARIVIDPPAGADQRAATAVSPIYLESLKTYEEFASSDSLFQKAGQRFDLAGGAIESLKRRVLKVALIRNTRILEISATLPDAKKAQALAKFVADSTVELNRSSLAATDRELLDGLDRQAAEIRTNLEKIDALWAKAIATEPTAELQAEIDGNADERSKLEEQIESEQVEIADLAQQIKAGQAEAGVRNEDANAHARLDEMTKQLAAMDRETAQRERLLGERQAHRDQLSAQRKEGQTALSAIEARLRDARSESGFRGERLQVIDPGIVPERPSSPNLFLNLMVALLVGLALPVIYLTVRMNLEARRVPPARSGLRAVARSLDE